MAAIVSHLLGLLICEFRDRGLHHRGHLVHLYVLKRQQKVVFVDRLEEEKNKYKSACYFTPFAYPVKGGV